MDYINRALPAMARAVSSNPEAYVYLAESIREWPAQLELGRLIKQVGWQRVQYRNLMGGIVALDRKSTRLNSSHVAISYAVFCLKKKQQKQTETMTITPPSQ